MTTLAPSRPAEPRPAPPRLDAFPPIQRNIIAALLRAQANAAATAGGRQ